MGQDLLCEGGKGGKERGRKRGEFTGLPVANEKEKTHLGYLCYASIGVVAVVTVGVVLESDCKQISSWCF
jgi:hypothetical protein